MKKISLKQIFESKINISTGAIVTEAKNDQYGTFWKAFATALAKEIGKKVVFKNSKTVVDKRQDEVGRYANFEIDGEIVRLDHNWSRDGSSSKPKTEFMFGIDVNDLDNDNPVYSEDIGYGRFPFYSDDAAQYAKALAKDLVEYYENRE